MPETAAPDLAAQHRARARADVVVIPAAENFSRPPAAAGKDPASQHRARAKADPIIVYGGNRNFIRNDGSATATDVLGGQLSNFATKEQVDFLATQHEIKTGEAVRRDGENESKFKVRAKALAKTAPPPRTIVMDPAKAHRTLAKMERHYRLHNVQWDDRAEADKATADFEYMNALRANLGMSPVDYRNEAPSDPSEEEKNRYAKFQTLTDPEDRMTAARASDDGSLMRLVALHDADVNVRAAAESRYTELLVGTGR